MPHGAAALRLGGSTMPVSVSTPNVEALPKVSSLSASSSANGGMERLGQVLFAGVAITVVLVGAKDGEHGFRLHWTACVVLHVALTAMLYALLMLAAKSLCSRWILRIVDLTIGIILAGATLIFAGAGGTNNAVGDPVPESRAGVFLLLVLAADFMVPDRLRAMACGASADLTRNGTETTSLETVAVDETLFEELTMSRSPWSIALQYAQVLLSIVLMVVSWLATTTTSHGGVVMVTETRCAVLLGVFVILFYAIVRCLAMWHFSLQVSLIADSFVIIFLIARSILGTNDSSADFSTHTGVVVALLDAAIFLLSAVLEFYTAQYEAAKPTMENSVPTMLTLSEEPDVRVPLAIAVEANASQHFVPLITPGMQSEKGDANTNRMT